MRISDWSSDVCSSDLVAVRRLTPQEIAAGKGGYRIVPDADSRGFYVVDLKEIARRPRWSLRSVVHHELLPGHMVQLPIEAQTPPPPVRALSSGGYVEGWAIFAEALRLEERGVGKGGARTWRARWSPEQ